MAEIAPPAGGITVGSGTGLVSSPGFRCASGPGTDPGFALGSGLAGFSGSTASGADSGANSGADGAGAGSLPEAEGSAVGLRINRSNDLPARHRRSVVLDNFCQHACSRGRQLQYDFICFDIDEVFVTIDMLTLFFFQESRVASATDSDNSGTLISTSISSPPY